MRPPCCIPKSMNHAFARPIAADQAGSLRRVNKQDTGNFMRPVMSLAAWAAAGSPKAMKAPFPSARPAKTRQRARAGQISITQTTGRPAGTLLAMHIHNFVVAFRARLVRRCRTSVRSCLGSLLLNLQIGHFHHQIVDHHQNGRNTTKKNTLPPD